MGREAAGVRGVKLTDAQRVNALIVAEDGFILTASQNGFGKLTPLQEFPKHGRGGQGVIALQITDRNGIMVGALQVSMDDEIMLMSQNGVLVRTPVKDISVVGRNTQGVRLIRLEEGDQLSGLERIEGLAGDAVDDGPEGPEGPEGPQGLDDSEASAGSAGPGGPQGSNGAQGSADPGGSAGAEGTEGPDGTEGARDT
jgi:DNA gyrase subunit A